jgi:hypothetical protein
MTDPLSLRAMAERALALAANADGPFGGDGRSSAEVERDDQAFTDFMRASAIRLADGILALLTSQASWANEKAELTKAKRHDELKVLELYNEKAEMERQLAEADAVIVAKRMSDAWFRDDKISAWADEAEQRHASLAAKGE